MKFATPHCPTCGKIAKGTIETIPGVALLDFDEDGEAEYAGETEVCWDGQEARIVDDSFALVCADGHEWPSPFAGAAPTPTLPELADVPALLGPSEELVEPSTAPPAAELLAVLERGLALADYINPEYRKEADALFNEFRTALHKARTP